MFADRQGSVIWVTDPATGTALAAYEYDGYGQITQTQGTLSQPYGYTGREYDAESGLYHYRARAYDPGAGVFVQSDPIGFGSETLALYGYVDQNPFTFSDPAGLTASASGTMHTGLAGATSGLPVWQVGSGLATTVSHLLNGLSTVTKLVKAYEASSGFPNGQEPDHCKEKGSPQWHARRQIRSMYKPLETMPRSCKGLGWDTATDVMERMRRARTGYKLATLRKLEMALCHEGGDEKHRKHLEERVLKPAKACTTRPQ